MWYFQRMLKGLHPMKEAEARAGEALRGLLEKIPILQVEGIDAEAVSGDWEPDLIARLLVDGRQHLLVCEYKSNGQPRFARSAMLELRNYVAQRAPEATPVFIAPYISPAVRQLCEEKGVGYLDLEGNARIAFGGVFIERMVADKPVAEQRELKSLFRPKSAQVLRAMLREPGRAWRVTELSEISGVSLGHVSNVRTSLIDREWARASDDGLVLLKPDALLDAWRDSYTAPAGERMRFYTPLHGSALEDAARSALRAEDGPGRAAFASFSAAQWLAPYGRTGTHYFFADEDGLRKLQAALKLAPASKGENVVVLMPKDTGLLADTIEPAPGAVCTSPLQTYLDLSIAGERGAEAADHLRQEMLSWPK
jgi:Transcriptional regulator, AbiEi antitoxin, Type IV TA system